MLSLTKLNFDLENNSSTTRVLLFMTIPGHLTFAVLIWRLAADHTRLSFLFICLYLMAALIQVKILENNRTNSSFITDFQVAILLYIAQWMVTFVWQHHRDPDNVCIPYLTAIGDFLGTALLTCVFLFLLYINY